jgi:cytoskeletal protein RodZ
MDLTLVAIIVLAAMIFVLSGMVGYLYWQQTRLTQQVQSISLALTSHLAPPPPVVHVELTPPNDEDVQEAEIEESGDEDDRVSVERAVEHVEGPPAPASTTPEQTATAPQEDDTDDIQHKTVKQLHEILTKKGIPFGKRDAKPVLLELLRATT